MNCKIKVFSFSQCLGLLCFHDQFCNTFPPMTYVWWRHILNDVITSASHIWYRPWMHACCKVGFRSMYLPLINIFCLFCYPFLWTSNKETLVQREKAIGSSQVVIIRLGHLGFLIFQKKNIERGIFGSLQSNVYQLQEN